MCNRVGSDGGNLQVWGNLINTDLNNPPIDPTYLLEGVFSPLALVGSAFVGEGASSSLDLAERLNPLGPEMDDDRMKALFAEIVGLPEITFGDDDDVGQGPLLPLPDSGLPLSANGAAAASAAAPYPPKDSGSILESTDQTLRLKKWKCLDYNALEPTRKKQKRDKVSAHAVAAEWHPTRNLKGADKYTQGSHHRVWWKCKSGHEWLAPINGRCRLNRPTGCSKCSNRSAVGSREFVSEHQVAAEWHPTRNDKDPEEYTQGSNQKVWWQCKNGHEWEACIQDRCRLKQPTGCRTCRSKNV